MRTDFKRLLTSTFFIRILFWRVLCWLVEMASPRHQCLNSTNHISRKRPIATNHCAMQKTSDKITIILQTKNLHVLSLSFCPYNINHTKPIKVCPFITSTSTFRANYIPSSPTDTTRDASSTPAPGSGGSGLQTPPTASRAICQVSTGGLGKQRVYLPEKVTWNQRKGEFLPRIIVQELC